MLVIAAERDMVFGVQAQQITAATCHVALIIVPEAAYDLMFDPAWPIAPEADQALCRQA